MPIIKNITAREILDSRGNPTIEATVLTETSSGTASIPSGASTGEHEALELRDNTKRFHGLGVQKAILNIERKIFPLLKGKNVLEQEMIDKLMVKFDGTENKSRLGANAVLAVSLACARTAANSKNIPLYQYLHQLTGMKPLSLPRPFLNIINGGKHADNHLGIQEFMLVPKLKTFSENLRAVSEIYQQLKKNLHKKYGAGSTLIGDEGGFAPLKLKKTTDVLDILEKSIRDTGYAKKVEIALDCAASEFFNKGKYFIDGKKFSAEQLQTYYLQLIKKYPIVSIEDPFNQEDFTNFAELTKKSKIQIVGDDLTVSNPERVEAAIKEKSCNCLLLKVNQIGTLTEALDSAKLAFKNNWNIMVSHRSGETEDTFIADLAVALGCGQIKAGAPARGERTAKYNRLLEIEKEMKKIRN